MFTETEKAILLNLLEDAKERSTDMYGVNFNLSKQYPLRHTPVTTIDITKLEKKIKDA